MVEETFDAVTRRAASRMPRRRSLLAMAAAGLVAFAVPLPARAGNKKKVTKKVRRRIANRKCRREREKCALILTIAPPEVAACCDFLATCNFAAFNQCLFA
jgi:hypothetical protein